MAIAADNALEQLHAAARALVDGVEAAQRSDLCLPFDEVERRNWFYWPAPRRGLPLGALDGDRRQLVHELVTAMTSPATLAKINTIIGLEVVLADLEARGISGRRRIDGLPRDPSAYYVTIFGTPDGDASWGVRFEGHHASIHATVVDRRLAPTPVFLGANPAVVEHRGRAILRPLAEEEDVARQLLDALPADARRRAVISDAAPDDIVTTNAASVEHDLAGGVAIADLRGDAAALASELISLHADRSRPYTAAPETADVHFAWAGDAVAGRPHYYRLHGARFLVEYDNTQNDANHAHSVWRDPAGDFGGELLREHHAHQH
ncbi:MAG TPA: DUF3500 domain-containing protein [Acidimicrobiales bacterium]|nr:DUF3500 domain-containing protein [Acidimicrobiales bacterium]